MQVDVVYVKTTRVITVLVLFALLVSTPASAGSSGPGDSAVHIRVISSRSAVNITFNESDFFEIEFTGLYAGSLNLFDMPKFWYAKLSDMHYLQESGESDVMGSYLHIRLWKNTTLRSMMQWGRDYHARVIIDFYAASRNYTKGDVVVDVNTLRYDVRIYTDCPADFIFLAHRIRMSGMEESDVMAQLDDHYQEIERGHGRYWLNASHWGGVRFSEDGEISVHYTWDAKNLAGVQYEFLDGYMDVFFIYPNNGTIVQDPYVKLPLPVLPNEAAEKIVNYFMEHALSISIGIAISAGIVAIPAVVKRRRL